MHLQRHLECDWVARLDIVGEAGDGRTALEQARALAPDVVVLDVGLPDLNGVEVAARLRQAGSAAKIVALSGYSDKRFVIEMLRSGAMAYVTKSAAGTELVRAIRAVARNASYFCAALRCVGRASPSFHAEDRLLRKTSTSGVLDGTTSVRMPWAARSLNVR